MSPSVIGPSTSCVAVLGSSASWTSASAASSESCAISSSSRRSPGTALRYRSIRAGSSVTKSKSRGSTSVRTRWMRSAKMRALSPRCPTTRRADQATSASYAEK